MRRVTYEIGTLLRTHSEVPLHNGDVLVEVLDAGINTQDAVDPALSRLRHSCKMNSAVAVLCLCLLAASEGAFQSSFGRCPTDIKVVHNFTAEAVSNGLTNRSP